MTLNLSSRPAWLRTGMPGAVVLVALLVASCAQHTLQEVPAAESATRIAEVQMRRTGCLGTCASYDVTLHPNGKVSFTGYEHVRTKGRVEGRVSIGEYSFLAAAIERVGYFAWKDDYGSEGCTSWHTDDSSVYISVIRDGTKKTVGYYYGCTLYPLATRIDWLARTIDDIAGTYQWIGESDR